MVAAGAVSRDLQVQDGAESVPIVINPPPPKPVKARMRLTTTTFVAKPHPRHPNANVTVETKKQMRLPKMSENRP